MAASRNHLLHTLRTLIMILCIAKITGIFYFTINRTTGKLETSRQRKSLAYTLIYLAVYSIMVSAAFRGAETVQMNFYDFVKKAFYVIFCCSTLLQVILGFLLKPGVAGWFNSVAASDEAMERIGLTIDYERLRKPFGRLLFSETAIFFLKITLFQVAYRKTWTFLVCMAFYHVTKTTMMLILVFCIRHLYMRFVEINEAIDIIQLVKDSPLKLDRFCRAHFRLCHLQRRLNKMASIQMLYSFSVSLCVTLFFSYYLYSIVRKLLYVDYPGRSFNTLMAMTFGAIALIDQVLECFMITRSCRLLCNAANETPRRLHELRNRLLDPQWDQQIKTNSLQFLHQNVSFTALGYFDINFSLLDTMAGTVLTYLVLFIQYDKSF